MLYLKNNTYPHAIHPPFEKSLEYVGRNNSIHLLAIFDGRSEAPNCDSSHCSIGQPWTIDGHLAKIGHDLNQFKDPSWLLKMVIYIYI